MPERQELLKLSWQTDRSGESEISFAHPPPCHSSFIKAVQGDTGHAQASMVTQVYSHTFDENRRRVANRMETSFFSPAQKPEPKKDEKSEQIITLLAQSPELADLLLAFAGKLTGPQAKM